MCPRRRWQPPALVWMCPSPAGASTVRRFRALRRTIALCKDSVQDCVLNSAEPCRSLAAACGFSASHGSATPETAALAASGTAPKKPTVGSVVAWQTKLKKNTAGSSKQGLVILRTRTLRGDVWLEREALPLMLSAKFGRRYAGTSTNCAAKGIASEFHALNHDQTPLRNQETKLATSKPSKVDRKQERQSREMAAACWERREPTPMRELSCAGKKSTWEISGTPPRHVLQGGDNVCFALLNGVRRKLSNSKEWFLVCASAGMHVCM